MKILSINFEWRIAVDTNGNYMPERYAVREGGQMVGGNVTKQFEGWERQNTYHPSVLGAVKWISTKVNHEGDDQNIIDSIKDIVSNVKSMMSELEQSNDKS